MLIHCIKCIYVSKRCSSLPEKERAQDTGDAGNCILPAASKTQPVSPAPGGGEGKTPGPEDTHRPGTGSGDEGRAARQLHPGSRLPKEQCRRSQAAQSHPGLCSWQLSERFAWHHLRGCNFHLRWRTGPKREIPALRTEALSAPSGNYWRGNHAQVFRRDNNLSICPVKNQKMGHVPGLGVFFHVAHVQFGSVPKSLVSRRRLLFGVEPGAARSRQSGRLGHAWPGRPVGFSCFSASRGLVLQNWAGKTLKAGGRGRGVALSAPSGDSCRPEEPETGHGGQPRSPPEAIPGCFPEGLRRGAAKK